MAALASQDLFSVSLWCAVTRVRGSYVENESLEYDSRDVIIVLWSSSGPIIIVR